MNSLEFIVKCFEIYGLILPSFWWPMVVLVIFFTLYVSLQRSSKKRAKFSQPWETMKNLLIKLEQQCFELENRSKNAKQRREFAQNQIARGHKAIAERNENELMDSLTALSALGFHSDKQLTQLQIEEQSSDTEMILPETKD